MKLLCNVEIPKQKRKTGSKYEPIIMDFYKGGSDTAEITFANTGKKQALSRYNLIRLQVITRQGRIFLKRAD